MLAKFKAYAWQLAAIAMGVLLAVLAAVAVYLDLKPAKRG